MRGSLPIYTAFCALLIVITVTLHAQDADVPRQVGHEHAFDKKIWKEVVGTTDYSENVRPPKKKRDRSEMGDTSSTKRLKKADEEEDDGEASFSMPSLPIDSQLLNILVYAIVAGLIGYILYVVIRNLRQARGTTNVDMSVAADEAVAVENIQELEIDPLLRSALAAGNYRLAIRIYFLGLLKKLDSGGYIRWKKDKTNREYLSELYRAQHYFEEVQQLTRDYELVWYGEHELSLQHYREVISSFESMEQKLKLTPSREQE